MECHGLLFWQLSGAGKDGDNVHEEIANMGQLEICRVKRHAQTSEELQHACITDANRLHTVLESPVGES
jgi:hypothetical protein